KGKSDRHEDIRKADSSTGTPRLPPSESIPVTLGMGPMPVPGRLNNGAEIRVFWSPSQFFPNAGAVGDERRRIAGAAFDDFGGDFQTGHFTNRFDDFLDAESISVPEVVMEHLLFLQRFKRQNMRRGEILDVDVVTHTGAI